MLSRVHEEPPELHPATESEIAAPEVLELSSTDEVKSHTAEHDDFVSFERGDDPQIAELVDWPTEPPPERPSSLASTSTFAAPLEPEPAVEPAQTFVPDPCRPELLFSLYPKQVSMSTPDLVAADPIAFDFSGETILPEPEAVSLQNVGLGDAPKVVVRLEASEGSVVHRDVQAAAATQRSQDSPAMVWPASPGRAPFINELRVSAGLRNPGRIDAVDNAEEPLVGLHAVAPRCATWLPLPDAGVLSSFVPAMADLCNLPDCTAVEGPEAVLRGAVEPSTESRTMVPQYVGKASAHDSHIPEFAPAFAELQSLPQYEPTVAALSGLAIQAAQPPAAPPPALPRVNSVWDRSSNSLALHSEFAANSSELLKPPAAGEVSRILPEPSGPAALKPHEARPLPGTKVADRALQIHCAVGIPPANPVEPPLTFGIRGGSWDCLERKDNHACPALPCPSLPVSLITAAKVPIPLGAGLTMPHTRGLVLRALREHDVFPGNLTYPREKFELQRLAGEEFLTLAARVRPAAVAASARDTARYLKAASRGIQLMAIAVPVLLFVAFRPPPKVEPTSGVPGPVGRFVNSRLTAVKSALQSRAGLEYLDDFRAGLDNWEGQNDLTRSWSYDQAGFVKPGPLAIYRPSMGMSDYQFEFLGQIDHHAIGWVFRAQDLNNYYVAKLVMLKSGPLPTVGLERYPVIRGKAGRHVQVTLPLNVHQDTVYRVRMEVRGADYALYVQDQLVHFWSDPRILSGGVGFFSGRGEQSRIRWMQVSHQYDAIGRLCAYFAPMAIATYNLDSSMGAGSK